MSELVEKRAVDGLVADNDRTEPIGTCGCPMLDGERSGVTKGDVDDGPDTALARPCHHGPRTDSWTGRRRRRREASEDVP